MKNLLKYVGNIILLLAMVLVVMGFIFFDIIVIALILEYVPYLIMLFVLILHMLFSAALLMILDSLFERISKRISKKK